MALSFFNINNSVSDNNSSNSNKSDNNDLIIGNNLKNKGKEIAAYFKKPIKKADEFKNEKGNNINFGFKPLKAYILNEGLFIYKLLNIGYFIL